MTRRIASVALAMGAAVAVAAWLLPTGSRLRRFFAFDDAPTFGNTRRRYLLHLPPGLTPDRPVPLVVVIHGFMQTPAHQRDMTRWDELADTEGFITVYPKGTGVPLRWAVHEPAAASPATRAELEFVSGLVGHLCERYPVDPTRIYASGMSNGGGLALVLAYELPELFAAVGSVAGLYTYPTPHSEHGRAVPLIAFHGELDRIVPIGGAVRRLGHPVPAVADRLAAYAEGCGCGAAAVERIGQAVVRCSYAGGRDGAEVVWYRIADGGHTWPGGVPLPEAIAGPTSAELDATRLTWDFFDKHRMPGDSSATGETRPST